MTLDEWQADTRRTYVGGAPGVLVSGLVWLTTGLIERERGVSVAFAALFVGGMLIFPVSLLLARLVWRRAPASQGNPLGGTALESTIAMIGGLFAAWLLLPVRPTLVLPLAAVAVGTHYLVFRTVYGDRTFWALGAAIAGAGVAATLAPLPLPLVVAAVELLFGVFLLARDRPVSG